MTGNRFFISGYVIWDSYNENRRIDTRAKPLCGLLNQLHEENEDLTTKKEDAEYELLHLKEKYEELLEEKEKYKKEMLHYKRELQKELVCQAIIERRRKLRNKQD